MAIINNQVAGFSNNPNAKDDLFAIAALNEDSSTTFILDVMANDVDGSKGKILYSLDDGIENEGSATSSDLLTQDAVGAANFSKSGALIKITADGKVAYTMTEASKAHFQSLGVNEIGLDTFTYATRLADGTLSWATVTVQIRGVNDVPVLNVVDVTGAVTELNNPANPADDAVAGYLTDSGTITFTDVDLTDMHSISGMTASAGAKGKLTASVTTDTTGSGMGGVVTWNYSVAAKAVEYLAAGQAKVETFTFNILDGHGGSVSSTVTVTITGTNDAPVVVASNVTGAVTDVTGTVTELVTPSTPAENLTDSGIILFTDVDLTDTHNIGIITASAGALGNLTAIVTTDTTGSGLGGVVTWNYRVAEAAVEYLAEGQTKVETFIFDILDGNGGSVSNTVSITLTGTNDAPIVAATDVTGAVIELVTPPTPADTLTDSGTITFTDVDLTDSHSIGAIIPPVDALGNSTALGNLTVSVTTDTTGSGLGGVVTWNYSVAASAVEYLAADQTKVESFTFNILDGNGGSVTRTVDVTITGTNDAAIISGISTASLTETDSILTAGGTLSATDIDSPATFFAQTNVAGNNGYGVFAVDATGIWNYSTNTAHDEFAAGTTYTDSFTVATADGTTQLVTVTIVGTNDTPVAVDDALDAIEDTPVTYTVAQLLGNDTDMDANTTLTIASVTSGTGGMAVLNLDGTVTFTPDANFNGAASFSYVASDGTTNSNSATVTVNVVAVNDAPALATGDSRMLIDLGGSNDYANSMSLQPDGRILMAGFSHNSATGNWDFSLLRLNANGSLDTTFDGDGKMIIDLGGQNDQATSMTLQPDGKILVAGYSTNPTTGSLDFSLLRLNANGSLDTTFDGDGKAVIGMYGSNGRANSMVLQSDGRILVAGYSTNSTTGSLDFSLLRLNADGSLDTTFDGDGRAIIGMGVGLDDYARSLTLLPDGRILVAGYSTNPTTGSDFSLLRLNADGSLDTTFDSDGKMIVDIGGSYDYAISTILQPDGRILVAGQNATSPANGSYDFSLLRLNTDGSLDTTFDGDGKAIVDLGGLYDYSTSLTLLPDGRILVAGQSTNPITGDWDFSLLRLNADGSSDTTFDGDGRTIIDVGGAYDEIRSIALQPDGRILAAGFSINPTIGNLDFSLLSLNADGSLSPSFGNTILAGISATFTENGTPVVLNGRVSVFDAELAVQGNYGGASLMLARLGGANAQDLFSASGTLGVLTEGGILSVGGVAIGTVATNSGGTLTLNFNSNATQALVNGALQQIAYSNSSDAPPASVTIDWSFNDGNVGAQGAGGALTALGSTTVLITAVNDAAIITGTSTASLTETDTILTASGVLSATDIDSSATFVAQTNVAGSNGYGVFAVDATGVWNYRTNTAHNEFVAGINYTDSFTVATADGTTQLVTVTITGTNDAVAPPNANTAPTFEVGDGMVSTNMGYGEVGYSVAVQADGKIFVGGTSLFIDSAYIPHTSLSLFRYNSNGTLDTSFDGDGKMVTYGDVYGVMAARSVIVQADGRILVAADDAGHTNLKLVRYNSDGSLDSGFGVSSVIVTVNGNVVSPTAVLNVGGNGTGITSTVFNGFNVAETSSVALQADGRILVAGSTNRSTFALARYNTDGSLDTSVYGSDFNLIHAGFGYLGSGGVTTGINDSSTARSVTVQTDGKILVAGNSWTGLNDLPNSAQVITLVRYNSDGSLDSNRYDSSGNLVYSGFDGDGIVTTYVSRYSDAFAVTVQADGKILVAGDSYDLGSDITLIRYNSNGSLDTSFGGDGIVTTNISTDDFGRSVVVQADGKILVAGSVRGVSISGRLADNFALVRYNNDGSLDTSFGGGDGIVTTAVGALSSRGWSVAVQADGKILVSGSDYPGSGAEIVNDTNIALVRYNADGSLDKTFDAINTLNGTPTYTENGAAVVLDSTVQIFDAELSSLDNYNGASVTLARNGGANTQDVFSGSGNLSFIGNDAILSSVTIGTVNNSNGSLTLTFNGNATQARVNETLSSLTYSNNSDTPPTSVQIDWTFNDGNAGVQSLGGALTALGSTTVLITAVNNTGQVITGTTATDVLIGGIGDDILIGNFSNDILTGGLGSDRFDYNSVLDGTDTITDFTLGAGGDVLDLTDVLGSFVGITPTTHANAFTGGFLQFTTSGTDTWVQVDSDGGGDSYSSLAVLTNTLLLSTNTNNYLL